MSCPNDLSNSAVVSFRQNSLHIINSNLKKLYKIIKIKYFRKNNEFSKFRKLIKHFS